MTDIAGGKTLEDVVNKMISDCAWGVVDREDKKWSIVSNDLSFTKPKNPSTTTTTTTTKNSIMTYSKYLDEILFTRETIDDSSTILYTYLCIYMLI